MKKLDPFERKRRRFESQKRWREKNPQKERESKKRYYESHQKEVLESKRAYYLRNREMLKEKNKLWALTHPDRVKECKRKRKHEIRLECLRHYSNGIPRCECCGETLIEFLGIDHINGGGSRHRKEIKGGDICSWLKTRNFPKGYRVLCYNCNLSRGFYGYCPHEKNSLPP